MALSHPTLMIQGDAIALAPHTNKLPIVIVTTKTLFLSRAIG
ncbi:hypothetical protein [Tolypothrix sp. PCC 7910]|nr:hypothetical protein [Tolypothrix sp. PCC 7910]